MATTTTTTLNVQALSKAVQFAIDEVLRERAGKNKPKTKATWNQEVWAQGEVTSRVLRDAEDDRWVQVKCNSGMCIAGNIVHQAGDRFVLSDVYLNEVGETYNVDYCMPKGEKQVFQIEQRAAELLGVAEWDLEALFASENNLGDVIAIARDVAEREGLTLDIDTTGLTEDDLKSWRDLD